MPTVNYAGLISPFATAMRIRMRRQAQLGRDGWEDLTTQELEAKFQKCLLKGNIIDLANYLMMLHLKGVTYLGKHENEPTKSDRPDEPASIDQDPAAEWLSAATTLGGSAGIYTPAAHRRRLPTAYNVTGRGGGGGRAPTPLIPTSANPEDTIGFTAIIPDVPDHL